MRAKGMIAARWAVAVLVLGSPSAVLASWPEGWRAPERQSAPMAEAPAPGRKSLRRLVENESPARALVSEPRVVRLASLPRTVVEPLQRKWDGPGSAHLEAASDLLVVPVRSGKAPTSWDHDDRVSVRDRPLGWITVGLYTAATYAWSEGGVTTSCGVAGGNPWRRAEWESVEPGPEGTLAFAGAAGWIDAQRCKAFVEWRIGALAADVADGLVYAFVAECPECAAAKREVLHVILPRSGFGHGFEHVEAPIGRGDWQSRSIAVSANGIEELVAAGARPRRRGLVRVGIEIARGVEEGDATALVYVDSMPVP